MTVTNLADVKNDNRLIDPEQMLRSVADEIARGDVKPTRAVVLLLDDADGPDGGQNFVVRWRLAQCRCSVAIAMVEYFKADLLEAMTGI